MLMLIQIDTLRRVHNVGFSAGRFILCYRSHIVILYNVLTVTTRLEQHSINSARNYTRDSAVLFSDSRLCFGCHEDVSTQVGRPIFTPPLYKIKIQDTDKSTFRTAAEKTEISLRHRTV